jgi:hypothetical protein
MKEKDVIAKAKLVVKKFHGKLIKLHGSQYMEAGLPDTILLFPGMRTCYFVEFKVLGKKPSPLQFAKMRELEDAGAICKWFDNAGDLEVWITDLISLSKNKISDVDLLDS